MNYPIIDLHQDLLAHINTRERFGQNLQTDFSMLKSTGTKIVVATAFPIPPNDNFLDPITNDLIETDLRAYVAYTQEHPEWMIIRSHDDIQRVLTDPSLHGLILHIEGLNVVTDTDWDRLERWYALGWRSLGPVWNISNPLGGGTNDPTKGLTDLGRKMIGWLQEKRMIIDFAHMNAPTFWDAVHIVNGPIYVSHGNAFARCANKRNYTDDQLQAITKRDGVIGIFLAKTFVTGRNLPGNVTDIANHIDHLCTIMGVKHVALGTDFGGILSGTLDGLYSLTDIPALWRELGRREYSAEMIESIAWKNAANVLTNIL